MGGTTSKSDSYADDNRSKKTISQQRNARSSRWPSWRNLYDCSQSMSAARINVHRKGTISTEVSAPCAFFRSSSLRRAQSRSLRSNAYGRTKRAQIGADVILVHELPGRDRWRHPPHSGSVAFSPNTSLWFQRKRGSHPGGDRNPFVRDLRDGCRHAERVFDKTTACLALATGIFGIASLTGLSVAIIRNALFATAWLLFVGYRLCRLSICLSQPAAAYAP